MIDIQLLRTDLEGVAKRLADRPFVFDQAAFRALEDERKRVQGRTQELQAKRNALAKEIGQAKAKGEDTAALMAEAAAANAELEGLPKELDAIQASSTRCSPSSRMSRTRAYRSGARRRTTSEVRRVGAPRTFGFAPRDHVDLGAGLGQLDFERATKIAGARFALMTGVRSRSCTARIAQFMLDVHTREHGYVEVYAPYMVNKDSMFGTGQLPKFEEDLFAVPRGGEKFYLIPTAEVPVTNIVRDEIVELERLPLKFVCHTPCFRSEAGSHGKDTRGMIRQHQFDKVELVQVAHPARSYELLEELTGHAETILKRLELPYRVGHACARAIWASRRRRPTTSRSGCRARTRIARSRRARTSRRSRRAACRRASGTRRANPSRCTR